MAPTLKIGQKIEGFQVQEYCKTYGVNNAESYIVTDKKGRTAIMKIIIDGCSSVEFADSTRKLMKRMYSMPKLIRYGIVNIDSIDYRFMVRELSDGIRLSEFLKDGSVYSWDEAVIIMQQVLCALGVMHTRGIIHNDVTPRNVIVDVYDATLVGFGHLSSESSGGRARFKMNDLNPWYMAPETMRHRFNVRSDIFSAGALMYTMLFGVEPWFDEKLEVDSVAALREVRRRSVQEICQNQTMKLPKKAVDVLCKMLAPDYDQRYSSVQEVVAALNDTLQNSSETEKEEGTEAEQASEVELSHQVPQEEDDNDMPDSPKGFDAVAGMTGVKELLSDEVMFVLKNPEKAKQYRLKVPNGMLFFGPPGCGKTFIAEKFAQESKLNFVMVKASDLGSTFVHGTQGKIKDLFDMAQAKAPTILCFDELDGMVPDRNKATSEAISGEVNEFLFQLNNCSDRGIFVIGTTNRPYMIDPAVMRSGRMDHLIYIPIPDEEARKDLFRIHLSGRPMAEDINLEELASMTDGYVASDIELIVNKTALLSAKKDVPISQDLLKERIAITRKSVSDSDRLSYDAMNQQMQASSKSPERKRIGFVTGH